MEALADDLWLLRYPLTVAGVDLGRKVTIVRLASARLVILSTGPFSAADVVAIRALGQPGWLVEAMLQHDTFAAEGCAAFPGVPFLAPPGFDEKVLFPVRPILPAPPEWGAELVAHEIAGLPGRRETVFLHAPSRTLIVEDLAFNFPPEQPWLQEAALRLVVGRHHHPGISRAVRLAVDDREGFQRSIGTLMAWDFDRVIVAHGEPLRTNGKARLRTALAEAGL